MTDEPRVAIACQGGGSHTAFTAGVLQTLLPEMHEHLVGLSGTSGGAFSALAAWYGLLTDGPDGARETLAALWADVAADTPADRATNDWLVWGSLVAVAGFPVPEVSPYQVPASSWGRERLREALVRHVDFDALPSLATERAPRLVVGTVDINGGCFEAFVDGEITPEVLLASAAVPDLFRAVEMNGHYHWDGLFSQNPPIHELMTVPPERKPDELWVVQINPQTREGEPTSLVEIADRRNELAGNISLNQELRFVETVNEWVAAGHLPADEYTHTEVRRIELGRQLGCSSKLDRSPGFIADLLETGQERAAEFLDREAVPVGE